jgi:peroxiredoxin
MSATANSAMKGASMPIKVGDPVPAATFKQLSANGIVDIDTATLLKGKKVVLSPACCIREE